MKSDAIPSTPGIYAIVNLLNQHCYVGSASNLRKRKWHHTRDLKSGKHANSHLQRAYDAYGPDSFLFVVLEHVEDIANLLVQEQHYIDNLDPEYNIARVAGNTLGVKRSPEYIEKMAARMRIINSGRKQSPEHIAKRTSGQIGKKLSPEHAAKARVTFLGGKHTPEARAKMSVARKGRKQSPEHVANRSAALIGRKAIPEHVAKATEAARLVNTGKKRSPEVIAKISAFRTGKKHSPETRAKMSATKQANKLAKQQSIQPPLF